MPAWTCPFCNQNATLTDSNISVQTHQFNNANKHGELRVVSTVCVCPNADCKEFSLRVALHQATQVAGYWMTGKVKKSWQLIPSSTAKVFPEYIPQAILSDYDRSLPHT